MKTLFSKTVSGFARSALVFICVMAIVISASLTVLADAGPMNTIYTDWYALEELVGVEKNEKDFVIKVKVNGKDESLHLTFPELGGFRLNGSLEGFFDVAEEDLNKITYSEELDGTLKLSAENGTMVIFNPQAKPWAFQVFNWKGNMVAQFGGDQLWYGYSDNYLDGGEEQAQVKIEAGLSKDEAIYGMGERFNSFNRVGIRTEMWNSDAWSQGDSSYKNIPIFHSSIGYMLFFNSGAGGYADIGYTNPEKYSLEFATPKFDFFFWTGTPLQNLNSYTSLTGTPTVIPDWASRYWAGAGTLGWQSEGSENSLNVLRRSMNGYKKLGIEDLAAVYGESAFNATDSAYNILGTTGTRMLVWNYPYHNRVTQQAALGNLGVSSNPADFGLPSFQSLYDKNTWATNTEWLDYSNPNVKHVIEYLWGKDFDLGVKGMMLDYGEGVPADTMSYVGLPGYEMHNFYAYYYHKAFNEYATEKTGGKDFIFFGRNAAPGSQVYAATFCGDQQGTFAGLEQAVNAVLSLSTSGFSTTGSDIGGLGTTTNAEVYRRWLQFGTFSPLMRVHGNQGAENPWQQENTNTASSEVSFNFTTNVFLDHYWLRENILQKIQSANIAANKYGKPAAQAMAVAFPGRASTITKADQYMFCDDFLFCPVLESGVYFRSVELPLGNWTDLYTGKVYEGGKIYTVDAPQNYSPTFIRQGSAIPVNVAKDTIALFDAMGSDNTTTALLVTAPNGSRTTEFWDTVDDRTLYTSVANGDNTFTVTADKAQDTKLVFAYGINAASVSVDGVALTKLEELPVNEDQVGYYVDGRVRTVIRVPADKTWTSVTVKADNALDKDYALNKKLTVHDTAAINDSSKPEFINDGDLSTVWQINRLADAFFEIDLGEIYEINEIVMKWTASYAEAYSIELSADGQEWVLLGYIEDGDGAMDNIKFDATYARYIRVANFSAASGNTVALYDFNVYGTGAIGTVPNFDKVEDESIGGSDVGNEEAEKEDKETVKKIKWIKKVKKGKTNEYDYTWLIIAAIIAAVVIIAGVVLLIILLAKRRKKKEAEAAMPPAAE